MHITTFPNIPLVDRLRGTLDSIRQAGPEHFDMGSWFYVASTTDDDEYNEDAGSQGLFSACTLDIADCGTTACLAGHAALAALRFDIRLKDEKDAAAFLDEPMYGHTAAIFYTGRWDQEMRNKCAAYRADLHPMVDAEWLTVIDYLERRIKDAEA